MITVYLFLYIFESKDMNILKCDNSQVKNINSIVWIINLCIILLFAVILVLF